MSEHREFNHKRREFKHREEESHSPVLDHEEREGGPALDQLAESTESTQLPEALHSLQQSAAQFGMRRKRGSKEEI
jgi:hypothetical protein